MTPRDTTPETMQKQSEWQKKNTQMVAMRLQNSTDADIIAYLDRCESKQGTIKTALREYMQNHPITE